MTLMNYLFLHLLGKFSEVTFYNSSQLVAALVTVRNNHQFQSKGCLAACLEPFLFYFIDVMFFLCATIKRLAHSSNSSKCFPFVFIHFKVSLFSSHPLLSFAAASFIRVWCLSLLHRCFTLRVLAVIWPRHYRRNSRSVPCLPISLG